MYKPQKQSGMHIQEPPNFDMAAVGGDAAAADFNDGHTSGVEFGCTDLLVCTKGIPKSIIYIYTITMYNYVKVCITISFV